ncbi:MAG: hypothetical protein ABSG89_01970 [Bacteroidales bacterium]|jgi:hypothetical protein
MTGTYIQDKLDRIFFNLLFGIAIPLFCFMLSIWISFILKTGEKTIIISALISFTAGLVTTLIVWLIIKPDIYRIPVPVLILIYVFYNICILGFFMIVPVFNLAAGALAGYYWVKKISRLNDPNKRGRDVHKISLFTSTITGLVCLSSAIIALISKSKPEDLRKMFHIRFEITRPLLIVIVVTGGILLVALQYYLTRFIMISTLKLNDRTS